MPAKRPGPTKKQATKSAKRTTVAKKTATNKKITARKKVATPAAVLTFSPTSDGFKPSRARAAKLASPRERAPQIYDRLARQYPDAHCALDFRNPYELLVATILSAQCTDKRVNMVTPSLFARYPNAGALAAAKPEQLEEMIKSTGFFRSKTKSLLGMAAAVTERHGGEIPRSMEALVHLPGVGRKTANVVLGNAFDTNEGVVVDTHVSRLSYRLGLTTEQDAVKIEQDLVQLFPREQWTMLSHLLIEHGRQVCDARRPRCADCVVNELCPSSAV